MGKLFLLIIPTVFLFACGGSDESGEVSEADTSRTDYCDCNDLAFDQSYNTFYIDNPREGFTGLCESYHSNGQLHISKHFKQGKVHGEMITYYANGKVNEKMSFDMNLQTGDFYQYAEDGHLKFHARFERGRHIETFVSNL